MFETSVVSGRSVPSSRKARLFSASLAVHAGVAVAAVAMSLQALTFPQTPPNQFERLQIAAPVVIPPEPATPHVDAAKPAAAPQPAPPRAVTAPVAAPAPTPAITAPTTIPDHVPSVAATSDSNAALPNAALTNGPIQNGLPGGSGPVGNGSVGDSGSAITSGPIRVGSGSEARAPRVLRRVNPIYPAIARNAHMAGVVVVECIVDRSGHIESAEVVRASFAPFGDAAVAAVKQWTFAPGTLRGQPVDTIFQLTVTFSLTN